MYLCVMKQYSLSEENYLKTIFHLEQIADGNVSTNDIAEKMETKASSVSDMIRKLGEKNLVDYIKYQGVTLTDRGRKTALRVIRKHRLWEVFLVEKLDFQWDEVHEIAEELEHIESEELISRLDAYLGHPEFDPHGDPIPDANLRIAKIEKRLLSELRIHQRGICVGVHESDNDFLQYLDKRQIGIGTKVFVEDIETFDGSMTILVDDNRYFISKKIAENIYVQIT